MFDDAKMVVNPYKAPEQSSDSSLARPPRRLRKRFALFAGIAGACLPLSYGAWLVFSVWLQPVPPLGYGLDGTPAFVGFLIIVLGCPIVGIILATIGSTVGHFRDTIVLRRHMEMPDRSPTADALQ